MECKKLMSTTNMMRLCTYLLVWKRQLATHFAHNYQLCLGILKFDESFSPKDFGNLYTFGN